MSAALTDEQRRAVERRTGSLFLQAGAGSGKTRVLVERYVQIVLADGVAVERLLAITFTEKAAAELRGRLRKRFLELGEREHAREAEGAWVSTIHGFCARVLRTNALAAGLDPDFRVLDEPRAARLAIDAFDAALEAFLRAARSDERLDLVASYSPEKLERMVRTVHSHLRSRGQARPRLAPLDPPPAGGPERARLEAALDAAGAALDGPAPGKTVARALERIGECRAALATLAEGEAGDHERFEGLRVTNRNAAALKHPALDELAEALTGWVSVCAARRAHADYALLARLIDAYTRRYADAKAACSSLDFDDLELCTRDLMRREERLRTELAARFEQVMVDEFQDTNPLQNELLDLLTAGRDNLFTVGDDRQSIYGFRHADVAVFRARRDAAEAAGRAEGLALSFRARPELVELVNTAFSSIWPDHRPLAPSRSSVGDGPRAELLIVDASKPRWDRALGEDAFGQSLGGGVTPWRAAEARLLAKRVDELTSDGCYGPGDIAVLMRAGRDIHVYEQALADRGIATYSVGGGGYWSQQQTADLRHYLAALANPRDELALYNVLASPLVGASLDALAIARAHRGPRRDLWWTLEEELPDGELADALPADDRRRMTAFVERFAEERRAGARMSLETLIDRAVTQSGYDRAILATDNGARRLANVRKLMRMAREWEADAGRDLRGFIDYVAERELLESREGQAPLEGESMDAVRLMTIHAAKGLEFPVVCVADLGRDAVKDHGTLQVSEDGRAGLEVASLGGGRHAALDLEEIRASRRAEAEAEEQRIFYVAMTRAREHLVVSGAIDVEAWTAPAPLRPPIRWVWSALAPGARRIFESAVEGIDGGVRVTLCEPARVDEVLGAGDRAPRLREPAALMVPAAAGPARFEPLVEARPLPVARLSYSSLGRYGRCGYRFYLERVVGMRLTRPAEPPVEAAEDEGQLTLAVAVGEERLSPLERGTIVHELLEGIDFRRALVPSARAVEERILGRGRAAVQQDVADMRASIERLLSAPIAARIGAARRARSELPFAFDLGAAGGGGQALIVDGVVDVHAEEPGRLLVVDWKTDALLGREPADVVRERYSAQRLVYALAGLRSGASRVEVVHAFLEAPERLASEIYEAEQRGRLEQDLRAVAAGVVAGRFEPTDAPHRELCHDCPGQPRLCSWGPERTLAEEAVGGVAG
ncbi:MAG: hypothetical protein NVSMB25_05060 [Thermoleophilaceae bacterium]